MFYYICTIRYTVYCYIFFCSVIDLCLVFHQELLTWYMRSYLYTRARTRTHAYKQHRNAEYESGSYGADDEFHEHELDG